MKPHYRRQIIADNELHQSLLTQEGIDQFLVDTLRAGQSYDLVSLLQSTADLSGDVIELGVWRGKTTKLMAATLANQMQQKTLYACDSYEGFGDETLSSHDTKFLRPISRLKTKFTTAGDVPEKLARIFEVLKVDGKCVVGFFSKTLPTLPKDAHFSFAHIDCDAYLPHLECLEYLYPRMNKGGIVVFDDYAANAWPGAKKAVDEFLADKPESMQVSRTTANPAWYFVKS